MKKTLIVFGLVILGSLAFTKVLHAQLVGGDCAVSVSANPSLVFAENGTPTSVTIQWSSSGSCFELTLNGAPVSPSGSRTETITQVASYSLQAGNTFCSWAGCFNVPCLGVGYSCASIAYVWYVPISNINVALGNCPAGTTWSASTGQTGTAPGGFTYQASGPFTPTTISMSGAVPAGSGYTFNGYSPSSQSVWAGGSYTYTASCTPPEPDPDPTVDIKANGSNGPISVNSGSAVTISWSSTYAATCNAPWNTTSGSTSVNPTISTTYSINCTNSAGTKQATDSVQVNINGTAIVNVTASPSTVSPGGAVTLTWSSQNASSCSAWWAPNNNTSGSVVVYPMNSTSYSMECIGNPGYENGIGSASVTVTTPPPGNNPPVVSISVNPTTGPTGTNPALTWSATNNPTSCTASGAWSGSKASSGTNVSMGAINSTGTYTYSLLCSNQYGSGNGSAAIIISNGASAPTVTVIANPTSISSGQSSTISWSSSGATSCSAVGGWTTSTSTSGTKVVSPTQTTSYPMSCTGAGGTGNGSATVTVGSGPTPVVHDATIDMTINGLSGFNVICSASPSPAIVGVPVTWTANVTGGTPPYTYTWSGTNFPTAPAPSTNPFNFTYQTVGSKVTQVTVRDNNGAGATAQCQATQLQVSVNPKFREF